MKHSLLESLESRRLFAAAVPDALDQLMLELVNRARANPTAEAQRYGIDLQEGLTTYHITTTPKQPLAFNPQLSAAADGQADWDLHNTTLFTFSHAGPGGNMPDDRAKNAGYALPVTPVPDTYFIKENAAINLYSTLGSLTSLVTQQHQAYFVDTANVDGGRGHRLQMTLDALKEIGVGIVTGPYNYTPPGGGSTTTYQAFTSVYNMGVHDTVPYLTGVAYLDYVVQDNFYTPGEGLGGQNVAAVRTSDGKTFTTKTWAAGGYTLALEPGTYNVYGFGDGLGGFVSYGGVTVGTDNVKRDFTPQQVGSGTPPFTLLADGRLYINGTGGADTIGITRSGNTYTVTRTGASAQSPANFNALQVTSIQVDLGAGDDVFTAGDGVQTVYVNGGTGNDVISGGQGNDTLTGAGGKDTISGALGDDRINGGTSRDKLNGDDGSDRLYGGDDNDTLAGLAGVDRLYGEDGNDYLIGGSSNDKLYGDAGNDLLEGGNQNDLLNGGGGIDTVMGGDGNDALTGGAGADLLFGNKGDDTFDAVDNIIDTIDGGPGVNTGLMDLNDVRTAVV